MSSKKKEMRGLNSFRGNKNTNDDADDEIPGVDMHQYKRMGGFELFSPGKVRDSDWVSVIIYVSIFLILALAILIFVDMYFNGYSFKDLFNF